MDTLHRTPMYRRPRPVRRRTFAALVLVAGLAAPAGALINVTGGRLPDLVASIDGTSLEDQLFEIRNIRRGSPRKFYNVAAEICHHWRRDRDGVEETTCCSGVKRIVGLVRIGIPPRRLSSFFLHPHITRPFCTGAEAITTGCPPTFDSPADIALTCEAPPRGFRLIGSQARFGVDVDDELLEASEDNNLDTVDYDADGARVP